MSLDPITQLKLLERLVIEAIGEGVLLAGEHVLGESNDHTPHEEGPLERSGKTSTEDTGSKATVAVSYDTPYAVRQHEDLTYRHDPGRTAKYLENALNAESTVVPVIVQTAIRRKIGT